MQGAVIGRALANLQMRYLGHYVILPASGLCWSSEGAELDYATFHPWQEPVRFGIVPVGRSIWYFLQDDQFWAV
jgi:hypothetical protein